MADGGLSNDVIASRLDTPRQVVSKWRKRFASPECLALRRNPEAGARPAFPPSLVVQIKALACKIPHSKGIPLSRFSIAEIRREVITQGLVARRSAAPQRGAGFPAMCFDLGNTEVGFFLVIQILRLRPAPSSICMSAFGTEFRCELTTSSFRQMKRPAYKQRQRAGQGWALRTVKLRLSRKLTYAAGLLTCFIAGDSPTPISGANPPNDLHRLVDQLRNQCQMTPLELVASVLMRYEDLHGAARTLFDAYDQFLLVLDDKEQRARLENLPSGDAGSDSLFQEAREVGHRFQEALNRIFLESNSSGLYELTKKYGVF